MLMLRNDRFLFRGYRNCQSVCWLRIYGKETSTGASRPSVIVWSELPDNEGTSVTNAAELLAAQVVGYYEIPPEAVSSLLWIEHWQPGVYGIQDRRTEDEFSLVRMYYREPKAGQIHGYNASEFSNAEWLFISRQTVEELTGLPWERVPM